MLRRTSLRGVALLLAALAGSNGTYSRLAAAGVAAAAAENDEPLPIFGYGQTVGIVSRDPIDEASGLAASRANPGVFWTMNDRSEGGNWIYAINEGGEYLGKFILEGADSVDYEDMSIRENYIYVADIGDNGRNRGSVVVYRVQEPTVSADGGGNQDTVLADVQSITLRYPEGRSYNAETLLVDPLSDYVYIVTKSSSSRNRVFRGEWPDDDGSGGHTAQQQLTRVGDEMPNQREATAGAVSWDGMEILVKNYEEVLYFAREEGEDIGDVLIRSDGIPLPYEEEVGWGEGISFAPNGAGYYTLSETDGASSVPLLYYERMQPSSEIDISVEHSCHNLAEVACTPPTCKWKAKKAKCVDVCRGFNEIRCNLPQYYGTCFWDSNGTACVPIY